MVVRILAFFIAGLLLFTSDIAVFAESAVEAVDIAAEEKADNERAEAERKEQEELYDKYFGDKKAVTVSENEALFETKNNDARSAGDEGISEIPDSPALLRKPTDDGDEGVSFGNLVEVGKFYKTYEISPGKFTTIVTSYPNTFNNDGNEEIIDNTIIETNRDTDHLTSISSNSLPDPSGNSYTNKANSIDVVMSGDEDAGLVSIGDEENKISLVMDNADFSKESVSGNSIRYNDVYENVDIQYTIKNNGVKEDIILLDKTRKESFKYLLSSDGIKAEKKDDSIVICRDDTVSSNGISEDEKLSDSISENSVSENSISENDIPYAYISAPIMRDAVGAESKDITLKLNETDDGYEIILIPDKDWLNDKERVYPVTIDPTVTLRSEFDSYTIFSSYTPDANDPSECYVGNTALGTARTYLITTYRYQDILSAANLTSAVVTNATLKIYQLDEVGGSTIRCYRLGDVFPTDNLSWGASVALPRQVAGANASASTGEGFHTFDVTDSVNGWVNSTYESHGFVLMLDNENDAAVKIAGSSYMDASKAPVLTFDWEAPTAPDPEYPLTDSTINLRPIVHSTIDGALQCYGVFADGSGTPTSLLAYALNDTSKGYAGIVNPGTENKYPDSSSFESLFPSGTIRYNTPLSNWQTIAPFTDYDENKLYYINAQATKNGETGNTAKSDEFLIYKITRFDTLKKIADHYGVSLDQILFDNKAADMLLVENNTVFIRNPQRNADNPYQPGDLTDDEKAWIDRSLLGRAKHCEYGFEPVNLNTGNFYLSQEDMSYKDSFGDFTIYRNYNSLDASRRASFGRGFVSFLDEKVAKDASGNIFYNREDGSTITFTKEANGSYKAPEGEDLSISLVQIGTMQVSLSSGNTSVPIYKYVITREDDSIVTFDSRGLLVQIKEKNGAVINVSYDASERVTAIVREGINFPVTMNENGAVTKIIQPDGGVWTYGYDTNGNLTSVTDPENGTKTFSYDPKHQMLSWNDETGRRIVLNTYDNKGRVVSQIDQGGTTNTLSYGNGQTIATDAKGFRTTYAFDNKGRTTSITYPDGTRENKTYENGYLKSETGRDGTTITYERNTQGLITKKTISGTINPGDGSSPQNISRISTYQYDGRGNLIRTVDADGNISIGTFNTQDLPTRTVDGDGRVDTFTYDSRGRILSHTDNDGLVTSYGYQGNFLNTIRVGSIITATYSYNPMGDVTSETDAMGNATVFTFDKLHRLTRVVSKGGRINSYSYNANSLLRSFTDGNNNTITYGYDGYYNINLIRNADGSTISSTYDALENMTSQTDPEGNRTVFEYDNANRMIKCTDASGNITDYSYDNGGNLIRVSDSMGVSYRAVYDPTLDLPVKEWDGINTCTEYQYNSFGEILSVTTAGENQISRTIDAAGNVTNENYPNGLSLVYTFDARGNVKSATDQNGRRSTFEYNLYNEVIKETSPSGRITRYGYNAAGLPTSETDANGNVKTITCDPDGNVTNILDAEGNETAYVYDGNGNITSITNSDGSVLRYAYDHNNALNAFADAKGFVTTYTYNKNGDQTKIKDALLSEITLGYDNLSNLTNVTDQSGYKTEMSYDVRGNAVRVKDAKGNETSFSFDGVGNLLSETDAKGNRTIYGYDKLSRVNERTDAKGNAERYEYDRAGNLTKRVDALNNETTSEYDIYGNVVKITNPDGNETTFDYNVENELIKVTDPKGNETLFEYDNLGNLIKETDAKGNAKTYSYDKAGNLISEKNLLGFEIKYEYDSVYNLIAITERDGGKSRLSYDQNKNIVSVTDAKGNVTGFSYDALNRLKEMTKANGEKERYSYDPRSNLIAEATDAEGLLAENNAEQSIYQYEFDELGNLTKETDPLGNEISYEYDPVGNITKKTSADNSVETYAFDPLNLLKSYTDGAGNSISYIYDPLGRMTEVREHLDKLTSESNVITTQYSYDSLSRITRLTDGNGNATLFSYDQNGNLIKQTDALNHVTSFEYDPLNNLISKTYPNGAKETFSYDSAGRLSSETSLTGLKSDYSYDPMDRVIGVTQTDTASGGTRNEKRDVSYSYDQNGNVLSSTDPMGNKTTYGYDGVDRVTSVTSPSSHKTEITYGTLDTIKSITDPEGIVKSYSYDIKGRLISEKTAGKETASYTYDPLDRIRSVKNGDSEVTYTYTKNSLMESVKDPLSNTSGFSYDPLGQLKDKTDALDNAVSYEYDKAGNITKKTDENGKETVYTYDKLNRLINTQSGDSSADAAFEYDETGNVVKMQDVTGTSRFVYDKAGRLINYVSGSSDSISYTYNAFNDITSMTYPDGRRVKYSYDKNDRMTEVSDNDSKVLYSYDPEGNVVKIERFKKETGESLVPSGETFIFYDKDSRITRLSNTKDKEVISDYSYSYDEFSNISKETVNILIEGKLKKTENSYTYDIKGELIKSISETDGEKTVTEYTYDLSGNRKSMKMAKGKEEILVSYSYDKLGRLKEEKELTNGTVTNIKTCEYDKNGNLIKESTAAGEEETERYYSYDAKNRLNAISDKDKILFSALYDGMDNRVFTLEIEEDEQTQPDLSGPWKAEYIENKEKTEKKDVEEPYTNAASDNEDAGIPSENNTKTEGKNSKFKERIKDTFFDDKSDNGNSANPGKEELDDNDDNSENEADIESKYKDEFIIPPKEEPLIIISLGDLLWDVLKLLIASSPIYKIIWNIYHSCDTEKTADQSRDGSGVNSDLKESYGNSGDDSSVTTDLSDKNGVLDSAENEKILSLSTMDVIDYRKGYDPFEDISGEVLNQTGKNLNKDDYKTTEYVNDINRANEEVLYARVSGRYDEGTYSYLYGLNRESYFVSEAITSVGAVANTKIASIDSDSFFYTGTGSISNLISENEDRFGISYTYDPFGNVTKNSIYEPVTIPDVTYESGVRDLTDSFREYSNPYTYNAEYIHGSLGIQYLRARYYDTKAGSFISKDSYSGSITETISQNRYTYANNNPLSYCDPSGHKSKPNTSNMCTAAQQAMERAANAAAARTGSASNKNNTPKTIQGVPSDVKAILEKRNGPNSANGIDRNTLQESLDRAEQSRRWAETVEKPLLYAQKVGEWLDSAAYGLVNRLDNSFLGKGLYGFADFVDRFEKGACKAYDKLINKIQEKLPGKDVRRIIKGTGLIVEGVFKGVAGLTLAAASAVAVPTGIGLLGEAAAALIVVSGGSDFTQGMQEIQLGWKGDSQTKTTNLTRDALFGGEEFDTLYHVSTDTAAIFAGYSGAAASINTSKPVTVPEGKISETVKWAEDSVNRPTPKVVSESAPVDALSVPVAEGGKVSTGYKYWKESIDFQGNKVYQRNDLFDPAQVSSWKDHGKTVTGTNVERMASGRAPIGYDGKPVNLHHLLQTPDGPIVEVSQSFHNKYYSTIHMNTGQSPSIIDRDVFKQWKSDYWMNRALDFD